MKKTVAILLTLCVITGASMADAQVPGFEHSKDSEHFRCAWNDENLTSRDVIALIQIGEDYYDAIHEMLGGQVTANRILVLLNGPAQQPDGSWGTPKVDAYGRIHLYQYGPTYHDYVGAFAHELVHAMRMGRNRTNDWFFEEGLAEFIALRVDEPLRGFPWYDTPVIVVAGQWVAADEDIPLATLRENHKKINIPCKVQSYTLRSSFFDYLGREHGDDAVLKMAKKKDAGSADDYEEFFGAEFNTLVAEWRIDLLKSYEVIEDAEAQAKKYRTETPAQYMPVCDKEGKAGE